MEGRLIKNGKVLTEGGKALPNELADFIGAVKTGQAPMVGMYEARDVVELCLRLEEGMSVKKHALNNDFFMKNGRT